MKQPQQAPSQTLLHTEATTELGANLGLAAEDADALPKTRAGSPTKDAWRRFKGNWAAIISLTAIVIIIVMAIFAPFMHTADPTKLDYNNFDGAPSWSHWFGTDSVGRDSYSRLIFGMRVPLIVGLVGAFITVVLGALTGVVAGYFGGLADDIISRFTDVVFAFPTLVLSLIVVSLFGPAFDPLFGGVGRVLLLVIVFSLVSWPPLMRFIRSLALSMKEQQFVEAARTCGTSHSKIMWRHLLPNMWGLILVQASFIIVAVITVETFLSLLSLGVAPPNPDLGQMLYDGSQHLTTSVWEVLFPSIAIAILIVSFTFLADGLRDAVDPRGQK